MLAVGCAFVTVFPSIQGSAAVCAIVNEAALIFDGHFCVRPGATALAWLIGQRELYAFWNEVLVWSWAKQEEEI